MATRTTKRRRTSVPSSTTTRRKTGQPHALDRRRVLATVGIGASGLFLTACGGSSGSGRSTDLGDAGGDGPQDYSVLFAEFEPADEPNGDPAMVDWPGWMDDLDPEIKQLYEFQLVNGELMRWMPCFCGCHLEDGHRNNRDCYVDTVNPDGSVVFDRMAPT